MHPEFQVHVKVPTTEDTFNYTEPAEEYHLYHPLIAHLERHPELKLFVRLQPDGSPLGDMCGCC